MPVLAGRQAGRERDVRWGPPFHGDDAAYYLAVNRNRRAMVLDMRSDEGLEAVRALAGAADVVIENFRSRQLVSLRLDRVRTSRHRCSSAVSRSSSTRPRTAWSAVSCLACSATSVPTLPPKACPVSAGRGWHDLDVAGVITASEPSWIAP
ncbi:CoA transferase, partial [Streptodolium elevatio]